MSRDCPVSRRDLDELIARHFARPGGVRANTLRESERVLGTANRHVFPKGTTLTDDQFAGAGRLLVVERGGDPQITLTLVTANGDTIDFAATTGTRIALPFASARITIPALPATEGDLTIVVGPTENAFVPGRRVWVPFALEFTGTGAAGPTFAGGAQDDLEIRFESIFVKLDADATAAARRATLVINQDDAASEFYTTTAQLDQNANQNLRWLLQPGLGHSNYTVTPNEFEFSPMPAVTLRRTAAGNLIEVTVANGQAGDVVALRLSGHFRGY